MTSIEKRISRSDDDSSDDIEKWKIKRLIKSLDSMKGDGTSLITLIIPKNGNIALVNQMLTTEFGTATNIKSRVNRLSVLSAIKSTQEKLKLYKKTPNNGLVIFCGNVTGGKKINVDFEPFKPINTSLYLCDSQFHTESLKDLLIDDDRFAFIIVDGHEYLYATIQGSDKNILYRNTVDLPKKHNKGGQSSARFGRIRMEKRHNYITKVNEEAVKYFIENNTVNVKGFIIAGSAELKHDLIKNIDKRLQPIIKIVDISKGGENGLNEAIELSSNDLSGVRIIQEKKLVSRFFSEIAKNSGIYCYGIKDTMNLLEGGVVEILMLWDSLETVRYVTDTGIFYKENLGDIDEYNILESCSLIDYIVDNYRKRCDIQFISDSSTEGAQFCKGFGGIGGILRYRYDTIDEYNSENNNDSLSEDDFM